VVTVVPNYVHDHMLDRVKLPGAEFNLGMIGICPERKRFDLALDILERLRARDRRYVLFVKGKRPDQYPWLWARTAERLYFQAVFDRIGRSPLLRGGVVFDPFGDDVPLWLRKIGWVLSVSDFESFHLAVAEGAAASSVPVVLPWEGADQIYPPEWVSASPRAAAERIRGIMDAGRWRLTGLACREVSARRFGVEPVLARLVSIVTGRDMPGLRTEESL
jgi:glycosyltransferase involved in cell wall biosynthesis